MEISPVYIYVYVNIEYIEVLHVTTLASAGCQKQLVFC